MKATKAMSKALAVMAVFLGLVSGACAAEDLKIEQAVCGAKDSWRDVTAFLQGNVSGDTLSASIAQPFDQIGGDPAPGQVKTLIIDYRLKGACTGCRWRSNFRWLLRSSFLLRGGGARTGRSRRGVDGGEQGQFGKRCHLSQGGAKFMAQLSGLRPFPRGDGRHGTALVQIRQMKKQRAQAVSQIL